MSECDFLQPSAHLINTFCLLVSADGTTETSRVRKQFVPTCFCLEITYDEGHSVYQTDFMKAAALNDFLCRKMRH